MSSPYDDYFRRIFSDGIVPREYLQRSMMQEQRQRTFRVCVCGDPTCPYSPPETRAAVESGEIPFSMREELKRQARAAADRGETFFNFSLDGAPQPIPAPPPVDDEKELDKLREKVEQWIADAPDQNFDDIIGNEEALAQLRDAIEAPVKHKELYESYGMSMPKGALLSGPPGCGKTMFARAAASEMARMYGDEVEMLLISGSELQSPFVGVTEGRIKDIFNFAREYNRVRKHPLLVFIDEAEVILPDRTGRVRRVAPWEESQVATFLAEMDGMQASGAFVLLASNRPEVIDQAVLRDGRCDFKIKVARPTPAAIEAILAKSFAGIFTKEAESDLVFAALEGFLDPHKIILDVHQLISSLESWLKSKGMEPADEQTKARLRELKRHNFSLEHIVSGAMAVSVPMRAKRRAFARDRAANTVTGVTTADVIGAVNDIFEENKNLEHSFALNEFVNELEADLEKIK